MRHMSRITCHVSHVFFLFFFGQRGEAHRGRVCYQRGLPRLVLQQQKNLRLSQFKIKSCIQETKHLSTDADCSTNTMRGLGSEECTKGQNGVLQHKKCCVDASNFDPRCCENQQKINFFLRGNFRPLPNKNVQFWDHFFPALFPKDSESLKTLDIQLREVGAK
jgi:hypothetical protein